jgi:Leucine-rich repeat (LRR) protein
MLIKFLLLVLALATPSFGNHQSSECAKFVEREDKLTVKYCSDFNIPDGIDVDKVKAFDGNKRNQVENLVAGQFKKLSNSKIINLNKCGIKTVDELAFEGLTHVEYLTLTQTSLVNLHENVFKDLVNLEYLNLRKNKIESLPANIFKHNENIKMLWLGHNSLTQIPDGLFHPLKKLRLLELTNNQLEVLHQNTFQKNKEMHSLMCNDNKINAVAKGTFANLYLLSVLDLSKNVCIDQQFKKHNQPILKSDEALEKCFENYKKLALRGGYAAPQTVASVFFLA